MIKVILTLAFFACTLSIVQAENANEPAPNIRYFSAMSDGDVTDIGESSFSVPYPIVVIDPIVFGDPETHPGKTGIKQIGPDQYQIRITGTVYDFIADMVQGDLANIRYITLTHAVLGAVARVPVIPINENQKDGLSSHPLKDEFATMPGLIQAIRPYPFVGRFASEVITLPISNGYNGIYAHALNIIGREAVSGIRISATINREKMRYDLEVELDNKIDIGLFNPVLVYIEDSTVTPENIDRMRADINGATVGLRFIDKQLQLDRPIMGVNHTPPFRIPNLVNVIGDPDHFTIKYKGTESVFRWSFTGM